MRCKNIYFFLNYIKRIRNFVLKMNEMNNQPQAASSHDLPKVSVVMCTYNGGRFLAEQLKSIIRQTYPVYEIIVQDDGSADNTQAVVEEYARLYPFIRFYRHEGKPGINRNFFSALARATGELIAVSDQDDIWELRKLEWQVEALGDNWLVGGISRPFSTDGAPVSFDRRLPNIHLLRMLYVGMMPGHTQLFRRELLAKLPQCDFFMYDLQLQVVAAAAGKVAYVPRVVVNQRRHVTAATYSEPVDRRHSLSNIFSSVYDSLRVYRLLRPTVRNRFRHWTEFLQALPWQTAALDDALKMSHLQASSSLLDRCRLVLFCIRHRAHLFHVAERNPLLAVLRAAFFPVSCVSYYRYVLADAKYKGTPP